MAREPCGPAPPAKRQMRSGAMRASSSWTVSSIASALFSVAFFTCVFCSGVRSMRMISLSFWLDMLSLCGSRSNSCTAGIGDVGGTLSGASRPDSLVERESRSDARFELLDRQLDRLGALLRRVLHLHLLL